MEAQYSTPRGLIGTSIQPARPLDGNVPDTPHGVMAQIRNQLDYLQQTHDRLLRVANIIIGPIPRQAGAGIKSNGNAQSERPVTSIIEELYGIRSRLETHCKEIDEEVGRLIAALGA